MQAVLVLLVILLFMIALTIVPAYLVLYYIDHRRAAGRSRAARRAR